MQCLYQSEEFMIDVEDFSAYQFNWEPEPHIPRHIVEDYELGVVSLSSDAIGYISDQFLSALQQNRRTLLLKNIPPRKPPTLWYEADKFSLHKRSFPLISVPIQFLG